jgi:hypothetical protein
MSRKRTRKAGSFNDDKLVQLICGHDYFGAGYGAEGDELKSRPDILQQMRADYFRYRDRILNDEMTQVQRQRGRPIWAEDQFEKKQ